MKKAKLVILDIPFTNKYSATKHSATSVKTKWDDYLVRCPNCDKMWFYRKAHDNVYHCTKCKVYFGDMGQPFYSKEQLSEGGIFFAHKEDRTKVFIEDLELET